MAKFSENLARLMAQHGLTQSELAKKTGLSQPRISNYIHESDHAKFPSFKNLISLAEALRCSLDELVGLKPFKRGEITLPDEIMGALEVWDKFCDDDKKLIRLLIKRLSEINRKKK